MSEITTGKSRSLVRPATLALGTAAAIGGFIVLSFLIGHLWLIAIFIAVFFAGRMSRD